MIPSVNGSITYAGHQLVNINDLATANYLTTTTAGATYATLVHLGYKQDAIPGYGTITGSIVYGPTNAPVLPHVMTGNFWTYQTSATYATINFGHTPVPNYDMYFSTSAGISTGNTLTMSCEVMLPTTNAVTNFIIGCETPEKAQEFTPASHGINSSTWTLCSIQNTAAGAFQYFNFGNVPASFFTNHGLTAATQSRGEILIRNVKIIKGTASLVSLGNNTASTNVDITGTLDISSTCTAQSYVTSSDQSIKTDVQSVSTDDCINMLNNIEAKTYTRTDLDTTDKRIGFIAQDIQANLPEEFKNVLGTVYGNVNGVLLGLDYSRLTPILWTLVKKQQELITNLESRL